MSDSWEGRFPKQACSSLCHTAMEPAIATVHYLHLEVQPADHTLQSEVPHQLFVFALFGVSGLAVDVKLSHQNKTQITNTPRKCLVDYRSTSMKTSLLSSVLGMANPFHVIRWIPWTVSEAVACGELLLQRSVAPALQRRSPQRSSHVEQTAVLGHIGGQAETPCQQRDSMPISREAALHFDHFVCSQCYWGRLCASHAADGWVGIESQSFKCLHQICLPPRLQANCPEDSIRQRIQAHAVWQRTGKRIQRKVFAKSYL